MGYATRFVSAQPYIQTDASCLFLPSVTIPMKNSSRGPTPQFCPTPPQPPPISSRPNRRVARRKFQPDFLGIAVDVMAWHGNRQTFYIEYLPIYLYLCTYSQQPTYCTRNERETNLSHRPHTPAPRLPSLLLLSLPQVSEWYPIGGTT